MIHGPEVTLAAVVGLLSVALFLGAGLQDRRYAHLVESWRPAADDRPKLTPTIALLSLQYSRARDLERQDQMVTTPSIAVQSHRDVCGNVCIRFAARDSSMPEPYSPDDSAPWMKSDPDGARWGVDPSNDEPNIGGILIAQGRDAADVPLTLSFGPNVLTDFSI